MSTQPRKERKTLYNLPVHKRRGQISAHLDESLLLKYNTRSTTLRAGDTVRIMRGEYKGTTGKILEIDTRARKVTVEGVTHTKAKSTQVARALDASNLVITRLDLTDPLRRDKLGAEAEAEEEKPAKAAKKAAKKPETEAEE